MLKSKNKDMVTVKFIKNLVEKKSFLFNLEQKTRTNEITFTRWICFVLAKKYTKSSLATIGLEFDKDHATVMHGLREFEISSTQKHFEYYQQLYLSCDKVIEEVLDYFGSEKIIMSMQEIEVKHSEELDKSNALIGSLTKKLHNLEYRPIFEEIALLSEEQLDDFESRTRAFMNMNKKLETVKN